MKSSRPEIADHTTAQTPALHIMQVAPFYSAYLDYFYRSRPGLSLHSSAVQTEALLQDAFSAIHNVIPYIQRHDTTFVVSNAKPLQRAWAKSHNAHYEAASWEKEILRLRIETERPDVLYLTTTIRFDSSFLRTLSPRPRLILGWHGCDVPSSADWSEYDAILSGLPRLLHVAERLGARHGIMFHPGMPPWLAQAVVDTPKTVDVCFVGSISPTQHQKRLHVLDALAKAAARHNFSLALHLNCHPSQISPAMRPFLRPPAFGLAMMQALAASRIAVDDRAQHGLIMPDGSKKVDLGGDDTINMRLFEATGSGALLLTEALPGLRRYFEPGKEVDTWQDTEELTQKILYWLAHEKKRASMAAAGRARCLAEHSINKAAEKFVQIIHDLLIKKQ